MPPIGQLAVDIPADRVALAIVGGMGIFITAAAENLRRHWHQAARNDDQRKLRSVQQEKELLADLLQRASQPFALGYPDGHLGLCNSAFEQLTGYTAQELGEVDWSATLTPREWWDAEQQRLEELCRTGEPVCYEKEYIRKDGTRVPIELLVHLVRNGAGQPEYYYAFVQDITVRKHTSKSSKLHSTKRTYCLKKSITA